MKEKYKANETISYDRIVFIAKDIKGLITEPIKTKRHTITIECNGEVKVKINEGKALREDDFNIGSNAENTKAYINELLIKYQLDFIKFVTIERVVDINTEFRAIDNQTIFKTFYNAIGKLKFRDTNIATNNDGNYDKKKLKGVKGYRRDKEIKLYSKFEEKGISSDKDFVRLELIHKSRLLPNMNIDDLSELKDIKLEFLEIISCWENEIPIKLNRYTKPVKTIIDSMKNKVLKS
ncbi:MAG: hypothetical protein RSB50_09230 [Cetobacterium sp.]